MAVVRLKRRYDEEPLDAVLLTSKKRKTEEEDVKTEIFHFATTLNQDDDVSTHISKVLNSTESKCLYKQHNYTNITEKLRADNKMLSQNNRFKVVNWFRSISDSDFNGDDENISYEQGKAVTVVDIESNGLSTSLKEEGDGTISSDYVYDIYYAPGQYLEDILVDNDFSCHPLYTDVVDMYQETGMEEVPDDEDDSNDENNWRNDYPDEDDLPESSISDGHMELAARMRDFTIVDVDDEVGRDLSTDEGEEDLIYGLNSDDVERYGLGYASYKSRVCIDLYDKEESEESCISFSNESCCDENSENEDLDCVE